MVDKNEITIKKTALAGKGQVRLNPEILKELGVERGDKIEVSKGGKSLKLKTHSSNGVGKEEIRVNGADMEEIGAGAGDRVSINKIS